MIKSNRCQNRPPFFPLSNPPSAIVLTFSFSVVVTHSRTHNCRHSQTRMIYCYRRAVHSIRPSHSYNGNQPFSDLLLISRLSAVRWNFVFASGEFVRYGDELQNTLSAWPRPYTLHYNSSQIILYIVVCRRVCAVFSFAASHCLPMPLHVIMDDVEWLCLYFFMHICVE